MTRTLAHWPLKASLVLAVSLGAAGCNSALVGSWKAEPAPEEESFFINTARFKDDDTFTAVAKRGEDDIMLAGGYDFNGFKLTLKSAGKAPRVYPATYYLNGTLDLTVDGKKYKMKKQ